MRNVMVTGATKGIGRAVSEIFAADGCNLAICSRNNQDLVEMANQLEKKYGVNIYYEQCDVADRADIEMFAEHTLAELGHIDVLVNNAGVFIPGKICEEEDGALEQMIDTNLYSAYHLTRKLIPQMRNLPKGHIFNLCSTASTKAYANGGSYSISKFALLGFTKCLREELMESRIKVTAILPGPTYTASWEMAGIPEARFMTANEVAEVIFTAYSLPGNAVVEEISMRPQLGDI